MNGETVIIENRVEVGKDDFNCPIYKPEEQEVHDVLVAPRTGDDKFESTRSDSVEVKYTLYFPKAFTGLVDNLRINVRGEWLNVIGAPRRFENNCPTRWNMVVEVGFIYG